MADHTDHDNDRGGVTGASAVTSISLNNHDKTPGVLLPPPPPPHFPPPDSSISSLSPSCSSLVWPLHCPLLPAPTPAAILCRLHSLPHATHLRSNRTRRASVAIIIRCRNKQDEAHVMLKPPKPKVKKQRRKGSTRPNHNHNPAPNPGHVSADSTSKPLHTRHTAAAACNAVQSSPSPVPPSPPPGLSIAPSSAFSASSSLHSHSSLTRVPSCLSPSARQQSQTALSALAAAPWLHSANGIGGSECEVEVLYMQRAQNPRDRWSGQMSFPGGRCEKDETDQQALVREVQEEIGWDLNDTSAFVCVGELDDKEMDGLKNVKPLAVAIFVYVQVCRFSPPLRLQPSEVSSVVFAPLSYFASLHHPSHFGRIYHPLMLQVLQRRPAPNAPPIRPFDLRLIRYPHKREGKLLMEEARQRMSDEHRSTLAAMEAAEEEAATARGEHHISDLDDEPLITSSPLSHQYRALLSGLRHRLSTFAHDHPSLVPHLPPSISLHRPVLLPSIEQLASLRFPALSLPGSWMHSSGSGGFSTGDDMRTTTRTLLHDEEGRSRNMSTGGAVSAQSLSSADQPLPPPPLIAPPMQLTSDESQCPPPFILWGMTLEKSSELMMMLGYPFMMQHFLTGSERRQRKYALWSNAGEVRWSVERGVETLRQRVQEVTNHSHTQSQTDAQHTDDPSQRHFQTQGQTTAVQDPSARSFDRMRQTMKAYRERMADALRQRAHGIVSKL